ncbi:hypothetical protein DFH08DRAFT_999627 [Mycena albidolilacea]|uniref:Uncharacterized protein n=1 Tax=Mycena albidolilacea TaxID=1033008 RepID=A0AAD6YWI3_9AGAR|nr:hypothetical protein DFH08DRAFT_999627 [Mycena albidolilacea]
MRKGTKAAQKLPANWEDAYETAFLRHAKLIKDHRIPDALIVNSDQTGIVYLPGSRLTWADRGAKQGKSSNSTPDAEAPHWSDCNAAGFRFVPSGKTGTHWSNQKTMREFVDDVLAVYFDRQKAALGLNPKRKSLWVIDVWAV